MRSTIDAVYLRPAAWLAARFFLAWLGRARQLDHDIARHWIGHAQPGTEVFKIVAERIEDRDIFGRASAILWKLVHSPTMQ